MGIIVSAMSPVVIRWSSWDMSTRTKLYCCECCCWNKTIIWSKYFLRAMVLQSLFLLVLAIFVSLHVIFANVLGGLWQQISDWFLMNKITIDLCPQITKPDRTIWVSPKISYFSFCGFIWAVPKFQSEIITWTNELNVHFVLRIGARTANECLRIHNVSNKLSPWGSRGIPVFSNQIFLYFGEFWIYLY